MSATLSKHGKNYAFGVQDQDAKDLAETLGLQLTNIQIQEEPEFMAEAQNEEGVVDGRVLGPTKATFTAEGFVRDKNLFKTASGQAFEYDGWYFVVENVGRTENNREYVKGTFTGSANRGVTEATVE